MSKFESSPLNKAFLSQISKLQADENPPRFIIGVSGGPDSMALLYLLHRHSYEAVVVHCNYGVRGEQSDKDQKMVEQVCMLWDLECVSVKLEWNPTKNGNFQSWARNERYRIFRDLKREYQAQAILTAHHQDDQIETIFQRILRGSGIASLAGIQSLSDDLFRPLLDVTKTQIIDFVEKMNIPYRIDASNEESTYARNFLRNRWFPMLEDRFPGWRTNILSLTKKAEIHQNLIKHVAHQVSNDTQSFKRKEFNELEESIKPVVFKFLFERLAEYETINKAFLEQVHRVEQLQTGQSLDISVDYKLTRDRDLYFFVAKTNGENDLMEYRFTESELEKGVEYNYIRIRLLPAPSSFESNTLMLNTDRLSYPITVRRWRHGDEIQPLGMKGSQLVSDHLTNRKISSVRKHESLVLESFDGMIAAVIFPHDKEHKEPGTVSEQVRIGESTQQIIKIEITE
jgi:tRNA(Ile)-lysidine synthase